MEITVKVQNQKVRQSLSYVGDAIPRITDRQVKKAMEAARDEIRTYPPQLPDQKYKRTGKRYRATVVKKNGAKSYTIESNPTYRGRTANPYVIGDSKGEGQAYIHQGRWKIARDVVAKWAETLTQTISAEISSILRAQGIGI